MLECSGGTAVACGVKDVDVVTIGFHFGVWNVKMDIFQTIRSSAVCDCGRTRNVGFWVKGSINYKLTQSVAAPEGDASNPKDGDVKGLSVVKVVM